jgi:hypothetical protein
LLLCCVSQSSGKTLDGKNRRKCGGRGGGLKRRKGMERKTGSGIQKYSMEWVRVLKNGGKGGPLL